MNVENQKNLIEESVKLELNISQLYDVYVSAFPEHADFWQQLSIEELAHARLIRSVKDEFIKAGGFPSGLITDCIDILVMSNTKIKVLIEQAKLHPPNEIEACDLSYKLERDVGESHYIQYMEKTPVPAVESIFEQIVKGDREHERRIKEHAASLLSQSRTAKS